MADVQLEHGYVKLANRLLEAIVEGDFSDQQLRALLVLLRLTYGWRRKTVRLTELDLARRCHAAGPDASRAGGAFRSAVRTLLENGVIARTPAGERGVFIWAVNKNFEQWGVFSAAPARLERLWGDRPVSDPHDESELTDNWPGTGPVSGLVPGRLVDQCRATSDAEPVDTPAVTAPERQGNTEKDKLATTARELACAANQGLAEHAAAPQPVPRIMATSGTSHAAAEAITQAGVPIAFAKSQIYEIARTHNANGVVRSLGYFTDAVLERWQQHEAAHDAARAPRPALVAARGISGADPDVWKRAAQELEEKDRRQHHQSPRTRHV